MRGQPVPRRIGPRLIRRARRAGPRRVLHPNRAHPRPTCSPRALCAALPTLELEPAGGRGEPTPAPRSFYEPARRDRDDTEEAAS